MLPNFPFRDKWTRRNGIFTMIGDVERKRLAAILGMLGSDQAGERDSAAIQAEAFRRRHNLSWAELLALPPIDEAKPFQPRPEAPKAQARPEPQEPPKHTWQPKPAPVYRPLVRPGKGIDSLYMSVQGVLVWIPIFWGLFFCLFLLMATWRISWAIFAFCFVRLRPVYYRAKRAGDWDMPTIWHRTKIIVIWLPLSLAVAGLMIYNFVHP